MEPRLHCPNGHEWIPDASPPPGDSAPAPRCPECGEPGIPIRPPADDLALDVTRQIDPRLRSAHLGAPPSPAAPKVYPKIEGYEILDELGRGGMGVVYRARQTTLNRIVALKMVLAGEHASERSRARFLGEAEIAAGLQHANIIQIYELGEDDGLPFISMEYVGGVGMPAWMAENRGNSDAVALFFEKLARAADWAHQRSVVHRDLKPPNVFIAEDGEPKIGDFGLAKRLDDDGSGPQLTLSGEKMGTPHYMAPEQAYEEFGPVGPGTDVYALGVMLYETLTGRVPLTASSEIEMLRRLRMDDPSSPTSFTPGIPHDLETVCMKCLRKHPRDRYFTAGAFADDLRRFRNGESVLAKPLTAVTRSFRWVRRHRIGLALTSLLAGVTIATGAWSLHGFLYRWEYPAVYKEFTKLYGEYHGIGNPLPESGISHRLLSYRIVRSGRKGHTKRLECIDSLGNPTYNTSYYGPLLQLVPSIFESLPNYRQPVAFELSYNQKNLPAEESMRDLAGRLVARIRYAYPEGYSAGGIIPGARVRADYIDDESRSIATPSGITSALLVRDERGREQLLAYSDQEQRMKTDLKGVSILRLEFDDALDGRPISVTNLDQNAKVINNVDGWASIHSEWHGDEPDPHTKHYYLDADGNPVAHEGVHLWRNDFDKHGNLVAVSRFGLDGTTPARFSSGNGATSETITYDGKYRRLTWTYSELDPEKGNVFREIDRYTWDADNSHTVTVTFEDEAGKPVRLHGQYLTLTTRYDPLGQPFENVRDGYASSGYPYSREFETLEFAPNGGLARRTIAYRSKGGGIAFHPDGNSVYIQDYDPKGRLERITLGGMDPTRETYERAIIETEWPQREEGESVYWNLASTLSPPGQASGQARQSNPEGSAAAGSRNVTWSAARRESLAFGNKQEFPLGKACHYLDDEGKPARCSKGNTGWTREYDVRGRPVVERQTGFEETSVGYTTILIGYRYPDDESDAASATDWRFLDSEGNPARHPDGYLEYTEEIDEKEQASAIVTSGYDPAVEGHFAKRLEYHPTADGGVTAVETYSDSEGRPARGFSGNLRFEQTTDSKNRVLYAEQIGFDPAEHPFDREHILFVHTDSGTVTRWVHSYFDKDNKPVASDSGCMERVDEFDDQGRLVTLRQSGFDPEKFPYAAEIRETTWAGAKRKGSETWTYRDSEDAPARHPDGYLRYEITYDEQGKQPVRIRESGFDPAAHGFATQIRDFDYWQGDSIRSTHWHYEDADGQRIRYPDANYLGGYFDYTDSFAPDGGVTSTVLSGFDPAVSPFFLQRQTYSAHSDIEGATVVATTFEDKDGKPVPGYYGERESRQTKFPDGSGSLVREGFDPAAYGFRRMEADFGPADTVLDVRFTGEDGKPVEGVRAEVFHLVPGSAADRAGLRAGDFLLTQNGHPIPDSVRFLRETVEGTRTFGILRDGQNLTIRDLPAGTLGLYPADRVPPGSR